MKWRKGKVVFCQGTMKCIVIEDHGNGSVTYQPLEGVTPECRGRIFTAAKDLFTEERER